MEKYMDESLCWAGTVTCNLYGTVYRTHRTYGTCPGCLCEVSVSRHFDGGYLGTDDLEVDEIAASPGARPSDLPGQ